MYDMRIITQRLKECINSSELSLRELQSKTGISRSALQRYKEGNTEKIPIEVIEAVANVTDYSPAYILGWSNDKHINHITKENINDEELHLVYSYRLLSDTEKQATRNVIEGFLKK